ncbi:hypothetical protein LEP1GSC071_1650 [Leptospira santarosai str. JET]|nr:hypothetical protein LEP1GSC071_1650 [Leptospira santarosai str. JET]
MFSSVSFETKLRANSILMIRFRAESTPKVTSRIRKTGLLLENVK